MQTIIKGAGLLMLVLLIYLGITSVQSKTVRTSEIANSTRTATLHTVQETKKQLYKIENNDQAVADFIKDLAMQTDSNSNLRIRVLGVDSTNGLLSVEVTHRYKSTNGKDKEIKYTDTVIMEEYPK